MRTEWPKNSLKFLNIDVSFNYYLFHQTQQINIVKPMLTGRKQYSQVFSGVLLIGYLTILKLIVSIWLNNIYHTTLLE